MSFHFRLSVSGDPGVYAVRFSRSTPLAPGIDLPTVLRTAKDGPPSGCAWVVADRGPTSQGASAPIQFKRKPHDASDPDASVVLETEFQNVVNAVRGCATEWVYLQGPVVVLPGGEEVAIRAVRAPSHGASKAAASGPPLAIPIGRDSGTSAIVIDAQTKGQTQVVSRRHCELELRLHCYTFDALLAKGDGPLRVGTIQCTAAGVVVRDCGALNGTMLWGYKIPKSSTSAEVLAMGLDPLWAQAPDPAPAAGTATSSVSLPPLATAVTSAARDIATGQSSVVLLGATGPGGEGPPVLTLQFGSCSAFPDGAPIQPHDNIRLSLQLRVSRAADHCRLLGFVAPCESAMDRLLHSCGATPGTHAPEAPNTAPTPRTVKQENGWHHRHPLSEGAEREVQSRFRASSEVVLSILSEGTKDGVIAAVPLLPHKGPDSTHAPPSPSTEPSAAALAAAAPASEAPAATNPPPPLPPPPSASQPVDKQDPAPPCVSVEAERPPSMLSHDAAPSVAPTAQESIVTVNTAAAATAYVVSAPPTAAAVAADASPRIEALIPSAEDLPSPGGSEPAAVGAAMDDDNPLAPNLFDESSDDDEPIVLGASLRRSTTVTPVVPQAIARAEPQTLLPMPSQTLPPYADTIDVKHESHPVKSEPLPSSRDAAAAKVVSINAPAEHGDWMGALHNQSSQPRDESGVAPRDHMPMLRGRCAPPEPRPVVKLTAAERREANRRGQLEKTTKWVTSFVEAVSRVRDEIDTEMRGSTAPDPPTATAPTAADPPRRRPATQVIGFSTSSDDEEITIPAKAHRDQPRSTPHMSAAPPLSGRGATLSMLLESQCPNLLEAPSGTLKRPREGDASRQSFERGLSSAPEPDTAERGLPSLESLSQDHIPLVDDIDASSCSEGGDYVPSPEPLKTVAMPSKAETARRKRVSTIERIVSKFGIALPPLPKEERDPAQDTLHWQATIAAEESALAAAPPTCDVLSDPAHNRHIASYGLPAATDAGEGDAARAPAGLAEQLRPHQVDAVLFAWSRLMHRSHAACLSAEGLDSLGGAFSQLPAAVDTGRKERRSAATALLEAASSPHVDAPTRTAPSPSSNSVMAAIRALHAQAAGYCYVPEDGQAQRRGEPARSVIIAHAMGLGKTLTTIGVLASIWQVCDQTRVQISQRLQSFVFDFLFPAYGLEGDASRVTQASFADSQALPQIPLCDSLRLLAQLPPALLFAPAVEHAAHGPFLTFASVRTVVLAPKSVLMHWVDQFSQWMPAINGGTDVPVALYFLSGDKKRGAGASGTHAASARANDTSLRVHNPFPEDHRASLITRWANSQSRAVLLMSTSMFATLMREGAASTPQKAAASDGECSEDEAWGDEQAGGGRRKATSTRLAEVRAYCQQTVALRCNVLVLDEAHKLDTSPALAQGLARLDSFRTKQNQAVLQSSVAQSVFDPPFNKPTTGLDFNRSLSGDSSKPPTALQVFEMFGSLSPPVLKVALTGTPLGLSRGPFARDLLPVLAWSDKCAVGERDARLQLIAQVRTLNVLRSMLPPLFQTTLVVRHSAVQAEVLNGLILQTQERAVIPPSRMLELTARVVSAGSHCDLVRHWACARGALEDGAIMPEWKRRRRFRGRNSVDWALPAFSIPSVLAAGADPVEATVRSLPHSPKMLVLMHVLHQLLTAESAEKVVVFAHSVRSLFVMGLVLSRCSALQDGTDFAVLTGAIGVATRSDFLNRFNDPADPLRILFLSHRAFGTGTSLHAASRVILYDPSPQLRDDAQAIARVYRCGQQNPAVHVLQLVCENLIERQMAGLCDKGPAMSSQALLSSIHTVTEDDDNDADINAAVVQPLMGGSVDELLRTALLPERTDQEGRGCIAFISQIITGQLM